MARCRDVVEMTAAMPMDLNQSNKDGNKMSQTRYARIAGLWHFGMVLSGLDSGLRRYIKRLPLALAPGAKVLDVGCGTGVLGQAILEKFPEVEVIATDYDEQMCRSAAKVAQRSGFKAPQYRVGLADIHAPEEVTWLDRTRERLDEESFDLVIAGAVLEHADLDRAIPNLRRLLKAGGQFINVGMDMHHFTRIYEHLYHCRLMPTETVRKAFETYGFTNSHVVPLKFREFPANVTRVGIFGSKLAG